MNTDKPILQLMDDFLANQDIRENSRRKYRDNLHFFINWLTRNADVMEPKRSDIIMYKKYLIESGRASMTVDNYLAPIRQFFKYLEESGIHENIAAGIHSPKKYLGYRKGYLNPDQVSDLLASINRDIITGQRDYAIINLMVRTGMRCIEVTRADNKDLRYENNQWVIYLQRKGHWDKDRALGITNRVVSPIADYIRFANINDVVELPGGAFTKLERKDHPLFCNHAYVSNGTRITPETISKMVKRHLRAIGIDSSKISAHSLRHTAAITALKNGAPLYDVQQMLGHRSSDTTQIYLRAIEEEKSREGTAVRLIDNAFKITKKKGKSREIRPGIP